jgi:hypothetical protein
MQLHRLFAGPDFHNVLENYKTKLVEAFDQLPDEEALDEQLQSNLKAQFVLDVPTLRPQGEMWAEQGTVKVDVTKLPNRLPGLGGRPVFEDVPEFTVHVPFDGDPDVFEIAPTIYGGAGVIADVVDHELQMKFQVVMPGWDLQGSIDRTVKEIDSTLRHLREQMLVFKQGLDGALAIALMRRKQHIQMRARAVHNLKIPVRSVPPRQLAGKEPTPQEPPKAPPLKPEESDVFISHASEDKSYVEELSRTLVAAGIGVWLDKSALRWGDGLRSKIDEGLKHSRYVIVVLSKAFLAVKKWTEYELDSAFALESANKKRILPLWHGITHDALLEYSPGLTNRVALDSSKQTPTDLANELLILLGRRSEGAIPIAETVPVAVPATHATDQVKSGETVAYAWYWTRDGKLAGLYVRKSTAKAGQFTLEEPDGTLHEGEAQEIAEKYISADLRLRHDGLRRSNVMSSGEYSNFSLP